MPPSYDTSLETALFFDQWAERMLADPAPPLAELAASTGPFILSQLSVERLGIFQASPEGWKGLWSTEAPPPSPAQLEASALATLRQQGAYSLVKEAEQQFFCTAPAPRKEDNPVIAIRFRQPPQQNALTFLQVICRHLFRHTQALHQQQARQAKLAQLEAKARLLEEYARIAAHNLRSPLFSMLSMVDLIAEDARSGSVDEEMLGLLDQSAERLNHTLEDLDELIQPEADQLALKLLVPLPSILDRVMASLKDEFPQLEPEVVTDFSAGEVVEGISSLVESVLYNVIGHALRSQKPAHPLRIELRTHQAPGQLILQVRDNGKGVELGPDGSLPRHPGASSFQDSKGLGLHLVQGHMDTLRGDFAIESHPDQGTTLRLTFRRQER